MKIIKYLFIVLLLIFAWVPWITKYEAGNIVESHFEKSWTGFTDGCGINCTNCGAKKVSRIPFGYVVELNYMCSYQDELYTNKYYVSPFKTSVNYEYEWKKLKLKLNPPPPPKVSTTDGRMITQREGQSGTDIFTFSFPKEGSILVEGQTYTISWSGSSISKETHIVSLQDKNGNLIGLMPETGVFMSEKSITWTVPHLETFGERKVLPGDGFRIVISSAGNGWEQSLFSPTFSIQN